MREFKIDPSKIPTEPVGTGKRLTLRELTQSIATSVLKSKAILDSESAKVKREVYDRDEILKDFPLTTFEITDVEVELKFFVSGIEKDEVFINVEAEQLSRAQNVASTIKLRLSSKKLSEFLIEEKGRVIK
ncbi:MAG: hypothetical protein ACK401_00095 [Archaeoglobaceae archaeon]